MREALARRRFRTSDRTNGTYRTDGTDGNPVRTTDNGQRITILVFATLLMALPLHAANTITFPAALERAMRTRAAGTTFDAHARTLEALPFYTLPTVRAEAGLSSAENLNIL